MLQNIISFSVRQKYVALSLVVLMAIAGYFSLINLPINSQPDVTPVQVLVITKARPLFSLRCGEAGKLSH